MLVGVVHAHGHADKGQAGHFFRAAAEEAILKVRPPLHAGHHNGLALGKDLPGNARPRRIGGFGRVGLSVGKRKAQLAAFRILHHNMRSIKVHILGQGREQLLQRVAKRVAGGQGGQHPVQGIQALARAHKGIGKWLALVHEVVCSPGPALAARPRPGLMMPLTAATIPATSPMSAGMIRLLPSRASRPNWSI